MRFIPTSLLFTLAFMVVLAMPTSAKADTLDDVIARVQSMMEEMAKVQIQLLELKKAGFTTSDSSISSPADSAASGEVLGASSFKFSGPVTTGGTTEDIKKIQQLLKTDSAIYPEGITSGFYGPATTQAIRNLQSKFGLDPVGVVGPATTALLERLISQQNSDGTYPDDILDPARPTGDVAGVTTSTPSSDATTNPLVQKLLNQIEELKDRQESSSDSSSSASSNSGVSRIEAEVDDKETLVKIFYTSGKQDSFWASTEDEDEIIEEAADEFGLSESVVKSLIEFEKKKKSSSSDVDDIDEIVIEVDVEDGEAEVEVYYDDEDDNEDFTVDEVDLEDIVGEIADELDIDEDDVYDLMDLDYNVDADDIDEIEVYVDEDDGEAEATIELESGDDFEIVVEDDDKDDIIEELADLLDLDDDEVDDLADFEFSND